MVTVVMMMEVTVMRWEATYWSTNPLIFGPIILIDCNSVKVKASENHVLMHCGVSMSELWLKEGNTFNWYSNALLYHSRTACLLIVEFL